MQEVELVSRVRSGRKSRDAVVAVAPQGELELSVATEPIGMVLHHREIEAFLLDEGIDREV